MSTNNLNESEETRNEELPEDFDPEKTMKDISDLMHKTNVTCPVHKINFSLASPGALAGLYLLTLSEPGKFLKDIGDFEGLTDDTWLYFEPRHIMEIAQIMFAVTTSLSQQSFIKRSDINKFTSDLLDKVKTCQYGTFKSNLEDILYHFGWLPNRSDKTQEAVLYNQAMKRLNEILMTIWFVPYAKIDEIAAETVRMYQESEARKAAQEELGNKTTEETE